jgi:hypothetical protein
MTMTSATASNWLELNLSTDEDAFVREVAENYKGTYVHTLESVFKLAKAIDILQKRFYGSGVQGAFADALVQYGFTARDEESAIDKGIRSNLKEMLGNEQAIRDWWQSVPPKKKRDWISARAIFKHWKRSQRTAAYPSAIEANAPVRLSPYEKLKAERDALVKHNVDLKKQLEAREDGDTFNAKTTPPREIARALFGQLVPYKGKAKKVAAELMALIEADRGA